MSKKFSAALWAAGLLAFSGSAEQTAKTASRTGLTPEEIIERSLQATGGREARDKMTSTSSKGIMEIQPQGLHCTVEFYAKAPNKRLIITNIEGAGEFKQAYDGQVAWSENPMQGLHELQGEEAARLRREATFNPELRWRELYKKLEVAGKEKVGERDAYVVRMTPTEGKPLTRYYDTQTFLLLRQDLVQETTQGEIQVKAFFSDYRDVDGVKAPFLIEQQLPMGKVVLKMTEVRNNIEIDDAKFAKPAPPKPDARQ